MIEPIAIVNPTDRTMTNHRFILAIGAYGQRRLMVWANTLDDALDAAIDWLADHAPGHLADSQAEEAYLAAIAAGETEGDALVMFEEDVTRGGNCGHAILRFEWGVLAEDPTRAQILAIMGRA